MSSINEIKEIWKIADAVTFDVDSTVIQEEGIDELAKFCGKGDQVTSLTNQAMQGNMTFDQSLTVRLNIIKPSRTQIKEFLETHPPKLTPGVRSLMTALQARKKEIFLVSGGFRCLIRPVAEKLNISKENIFANSLKFNFTEEYAGFDENELTSKSGGKAKVMKHLKEVKGFRTVIHIGDGATDLEACPPADGFIASRQDVEKKMKNKQLTTNTKEIQKRNKRVDELKKRATKERNVHILEKYKTLLETRETLEETSAHSLETADTVLIPPDEESMSDEFDDRLDEVQEEINSVEVPRPVGNEGLQPAGNQENQNNERSRDNYAPEIPPPASSTNPHSSQLYPDRTYVGRRIENPKDWIYLTDDIKIHKDKWETMRSKSDSVFVKELAQALWGTQVLKKRCLDKKRANKHKKADEEPRRPLTPEKLQILKRFGGNIVRDFVKSRSIWFVTDFNELIDALDENPMK